MKKRIWHRCKGDCCERFYLREPPEWWEARFKEWVDMQLGGPVVIFNEETITIAAMIEYLDSVRFNVEGTPIGFETPVYWYRCKNHTPGGDCGIYSRRPKMCSLYPYGKPCYYPGCTWKDAELATNPAFDMRIVKRRLIQKFYATEE